MVWICEDKAQPGCFSAVKIISADKCKRVTYCPTRDCFVPDEVALWMPLANPRVLSLNEVFYEKYSRHWYLVTDFDANDIDLFHYIEVYGPMENKEAASIVKQVIEVCYYLAGEGVDHRDIKDENILYNTRTGKIKLIDFGSASVLTIDTYKSYQGTDVYLPPEYYRNRCYDAFPACTWSIGCLAFVLLNGDCPFDTKQDVKEYTTLRWKVDKTKLDLQAISFIEMCLEGDPNMRIELDSLIHHHWIVDSA